jgi:hypothetical protein
MLTTKPTRTFPASVVSSSLARTDRCSTTVRVPARRPSRTARPNSAREVRRWSRVSTTRTVPTELALTSAQAARRLRPLRRRDARMARPARVRIRRRKPCVLWRRRLFGWNVRLLTSLFSGVGVVTRLFSDRVRTIRLAPPTRGEPPAQQRAGVIVVRGHAAPVDTGSTAQRYAVGVRGSNRGAPREPEGRTAHHGTARWGPSIRHAGRYSQTAHPGHGLCLA